MRGEANIRFRIWDCGLRIADFGKNADEGERQKAQGKSLRAKVKGEDSGLRLEAKAKETKTLLRLNGKTK